eukprot:evm.model.NODE_33100_length_7234_cov_40.057369.3
MTAGGGFAETSKISGTNIMYTAIIPAIIQNHPTEGKPPTCSLLFPLSSVLAIVQAWIRYAPLSQARRTGKRTQSPFINTKCTHNNSGSCNAKECDPDKISGIKVIHPP